MHLYPELADLGELDRVVLSRPDRLGEVLPHLLAVDVEGGHELDVADVVAAEVDMHQAGDILGRVGILVVGDALDEGVGAVTDPDDRDAHLAVVDKMPVGDGAVAGRSSIGAHCVPSPPRGGSGCYYAAPPSRLHLSATRGRWLTPPR